MTILFQFLEGSSDPLTAAATIYFSYLSSNQWKGLGKSAVSDGTNNFTQSGLIETSIPVDATTANTLLPAGYIWLRFSAQNNIEGVCKLLAVLPQAAAVTYAPTPLNPPGFVNTPLAAGTITKLQQPVSGIKSIQQPYPSFGGQGEESDAAFAIRVSERLRHKDRAIAIWDYERLVLNAFPRLHKVKCLSHTMLQAAPDGTIIYSELAPGYVTVITIPDLTQRNDANPLQPYTSSAVLTAVQTYLQQRTSGLATVCAGNPQFEELRMEFTVGLNKGYYDINYYQTQLAQAIMQFLTPWAFGGTADIQFGGQVYKSTLIDFIENLPYVDYLLDVYLYHRPGAGKPESGDLQVAVASTARSILVSAPVCKYSIKALLYQDPSQVKEVCQPND